MPPSPAAPASLPPRLDVIAVGAHPDDVEIGCGGTLAKLAEQGYRVGIVDLTDGEPTPASPGPEVRLAEAAQAAQILGVSERITLDLPNRRLMDGFDERVALAKVFRRWRPQLVLGLGEKTPLASPDHWQAMQITDAAVFYSRLTKWDEHFDHLPPHRIEAQLYYSLSFYSLDPPTIGGDFVVDISSTLAAKLAAVRAYATQFPPEKQELFARVEAMNRWFGSAAGFRAGERLASPRAIGVTDLMGSLHLSAGSRSDN
ncbi:PIG-L family deacetylase [Botrimarina hoheduenensis]|uniref:Mycothiol S-conjugate amidase n=1 Tax=Botrimarina hoheduenensis TaxID=2528000 RepID=A0A5C5WEW5_9BACT|nr:PIG-L family deacetylase [Botrimarina hoheduenensis]TWT48619.1 Mycothiol S-conjugate amidase [Botrimarina hoheduenensis]